MDLEAVGVSTLEAMAMAGLESAAPDEVVVALLDARRGEWYAGGWRAGAGEGALPVPVVAEGLYAPARLAAACPPRVRTVAPQGGAWEAELASAVLELRASRPNVRAPS